jgi:two-component system, OmpR family, sensor histidine kinase BaeS
MNTVKFPHQRRPGWWPENETWPPSGIRRERFRGHFFRRVGCLFLVFNVFISVIVLLLAGALANLMGIVRLPGSYQWAILLGAVVFLLGFFFLAWAGRTLRRMSMPLDDLIMAADRIAQGDYSVRVKEQGPAEVRSLGRVFNSMASRLKDVDEQRRNLIADITHELRTPITVIQGNVEGVLDGVYEADDAHLKSILEEIKLLSRLVDDLRTLALAESGALQLEKEPTDLAVLIGETVAELRPQYDEAGVSLETDLPADAPLLKVDPERIRQVLANLLVNAVRHTPPGGSVRIHFEMIQAKEAQVTVEDTGTGIQPEDLAHIFDRFYKSKDSSGMGLGLAIAKNLVQAHGGTIQAKSQPGQGAIFSISLPV